MKQVVSITLSSETLQVLDKLAAKHGGNRSAAIEAAIWALAKTELPAATVKEAVKNALIDGWKASSNPAAPYILQLLEGKRLPGGSE